ncbi:MAG: oxidoreductase [Chitinivibrionales bacterium]|nr:oxidoreductase [Chitinivibrionales bacterium]
MNTAIISNTQLSPSAFVLRFERRNFDFVPGQYLEAGVAGTVQLREYSVYSPCTADYLEILVKYIPRGRVSELLHHAQPGDQLHIQGPYGDFGIRDEAMNSSLLFISSGTGIAPFHSITASYDDLDYRLLHGVARLTECYQRKDYDRERYVACLSREPKGDFHGRVTDYLRQNPPDPQSKCYLCGNSNMIYDALAILKECGIAKENCFAEIYF